ADVRQTGEALAAGDELGHVELLHVKPAAALAGRRPHCYALSLARARPSRALDPRFAGRLLQARNALAPAGIAIARGHDRHPHLVVQLLVDHRAEDDVGVWMRRLGDRLRSLVDLPQ